MLDRRSAPKRTPMPRRAAPLRASRPAPRRAPGGAVTAPGYAPCCGGNLPGEGPEATVCRCGSDWAAPFPGAHLDRAQWEAIGAMLWVRSGGRCEIRAAVCRGGPLGDLTGMARSEVSLHHRLPRGAGGTTRRDVHSLARLMLVCGTGTTGCHAWAEVNRTAATARGILIRHRTPGDEADPAAVPLVLPGGRRVLLDPRTPLYLPAPGDAYDLTPWP